MKKSDLKKIVENVVNKMDEVWVNWEEENKSDIKETSVADPIFHNMQRIKNYSDWGIAHAEHVPIQEIISIFQKIQKDVNELIKNRESENKYKNRVRGMK
jgi:hypothetical protein